MLRRNGPFHIHLICSVNKSHIYWFWQGRSVIVTSKSEKWRCTSADSPAENSPGALQPLFVMKNLSKKKAFATNIKKFRRRSRTRYVVHNWAVFNRTSGRNTNQDMHILFYFSERWPAIVWVSGFQTIIRRPRPSAVHPLGLHWGIQRRRRWPDERTITSFRKKVLENWNKDKQCMVQIWYCINIWLRRVWDELWGRLVSEAWIPTRNSHTWSSVMSIKYLTLIKEELFLTLIRDIRNADFLNYDEIGCEYSLTMPIQSMAYHFWEIYSI